MIFIPTNVDPEMGVKGVDYYCRIKDVVDRLNERRNDTESSIADSLRRGISKPSKKPVLIPHLPTRRLRSRDTGDQNETQIEKEDEIDVSWKNGGQNYPTKSSSVGSKFQVSSLPKAGSYKNEKCPARYVMERTKRY